MHWLNRRIFARAAAVIVLDRFMAERIERKYKIRGRLEILPPWPHVGAGRREASGAGCQVSGVSMESDTPNLTPDTYREGRFVVMYSGNHSPANPITTLLQAAVVLRDDSRLMFVFVGGGLGKRDVDQAIETHRLKNVRSLPYQPLDRLQQSLSAADLHVVTLGNDMVGIIHPCKIYGAMAVGRPVLFVGPRPSHAADLIDELMIGWQLNHGDVQGLVNLLREIVEMPRAELADIGERAQHVIRESFEKELLCGAMCELLERVGNQSAVHETVHRPLGLDRLEPVASDLP
jgi:hypothetical protein